MSTSQEKQPQQPKSSDTKKGKKGKKNQKTEEELAAEAKAAKAAAQAAKEAAEALALLEAEEAKVLVSIMACKGTGEELATEVLSLCAAAKCTPRPHVILEAVLTQKVATSTCLHIEYIFRVVSQIYSNLLIFKNIH